MTLRKSVNEVEPMTLEAAADYARQIVELEARGPGDVEDALFRLERHYGIGANQLNHLRSRRAKSCDVSLYARIRMAYLDLCERKANALLHKVQLERAAGDDSNQDIASELEALAAKIRGQKAAIGGQAR